MTATGDSDALHNDNAAIGFESQLCVAMGGNRVERFRNLNAGSSECRRPSRRDDIAKVQSVNAQEMRRRAERGDA